MDRTPKLDAAREQRGIYSVADDDPDHEEIMKKSLRKIGDTKSLSDALRSHQTSQPERFKLEATFVQVVCPELNFQN